VITLNLLKRVVVVVVDELQAKHIVLVVVGLVDLI